MATSSGENKINANDESKNGQTRSNYVPAKQDRHLQSLDFNQEGHLLLGCSSLTSRHWTGSIWYYEDPAGAPDVTNCLTGLELDNGLFEAIFLGDSGKQMVCGMDNGSLELYKLSYSEEMNTTFPFLEQLNTIQEHHDLITGIGVSLDKLNLLTSSYDKSVVVLDLNTFARKRSYFMAHNDLILSLDTNPNDTNTFATSSQDGKVAIWDLREPSSKSVTYENVDVSPTCVKFVPGQEGLVLIGSVSGELGVYDIRNPGEKIQSDNTNKEHIFKIRFSQDKPETFAVSSDSGTVRIYEINPKDSSLNLKQTNTGNHTDFVRGLAWQPNVENVLWSCGWDQKVFSTKV